MLTRHPGPLPEPVNNLYFWEWLKTWQPHPPHTSFHAVLGVCPMTRPRIVMGGCIAMCKFQFSSSWNFQRYNKGSEQCRNIEKVAVYSLWNLLSSKLRYFYPDQIPLKSLKVNCSYSPKQLIRFCHSSIPLWNKERKNLPNGQQDEIFFMTLCKFVAHCRETDLVLLISPVIAQCHRSSAGEKLPASSLQ